MLDPVVCGRMRLGEPRVHVQALCELNHLLETLGFRSSSLGDTVVAKGDCDERQGRSRRTEATGDDHGCAPAHGTGSDGASSRCEAARTATTRSRRLDGRGGQQ